MRILVIDQATIHTSYNIIDVTDKKPTWLCASVISIRKGNAVERMVELRNRLQELIEEYSITDMVIEDLNWSRKVNANTTIVLCKLLGMMEVLAVDNKINVHIMNIIKWKRDAGILTRTRDEQKKESIKLALKRFPDYKAIILKSDDVGDALNMGIAFLRQEEIL